MPVKGVREEPAGSLVGGSFARFGRQIARERVKQRGHALLMSSQRFARGCIWRYRPRDIRAGLNEPGTQSLQPMAQLFCRPAIILVIGGDDSAGRVSEHR